MPAISTRQPIRFLILLPRTTSLKPTQAAIFLAPKVSDSGPFPKGQEEIWESQVGEYKRKERKKKKDPFN